MQKNMYMPSLAKVVGIREETAHTRSLIIALEKEKPVVFEPGQFIELTLFGHGEFPVSVADIIDESPQRFMVTIQEMGKVTRAVGQLREGAQVGIRGPFGRGFPLRAFAGWDVNIISGGVGLPTQVALPIVALLVPLTRPLVEPTVAVYVVLPLGTVKVEMAPPSPRFSVPVNVNVVVVGTARMVCVAFGLRLEVLLGQGVPEPTEPKVSHVTPARVTVPPALMPAVVPVATVPV